MPKGEIRMKNGASVHYDDVRYEGDKVVFKRSYSHDVQAVNRSEVEKVEPGEWHRTPFGSCKSLDDAEVRNATKRNS
jgi:hypothetical protein